MKIALKVNNDDNVATIFDELKAGETVTVIDKSGSKEDIVVKCDIPYGHKIAIKKINKGDHIIKYGECIGAASEDIEKSDYVHIHNLESLRGRGDLERREK